MSKIKDYLLSKYEEGEIMEKVWGETEGACAWCNDKAQTSYVGEQAGGEVVEYQVCVPCDKEMN